MRMAALLLVLAVLLAGCAGRYARAGGACSGLASLGASGPSEPVEEACSACSDLLGPAGQQLECMRSVRPVASQSSSGNASGAARYLALHGRGDEWAACKALADERSRLACACCLVGGTDRRYSAGDGCSSASGRIAEGLYLAGGRCLVPACLDDAECTGGLRCANGTCADPFALDRAELEEFVKGYEGFKEKVYRDDLGNPTACWGHLVTAADGLSVGQAVPESRCDALFKKDLDRALGETQEVFGADWDRMPRPVKNVMVDMVFNLGKRQFEDFDRTIAAVRSGDYRAAADYLRRSDWYRQVGRRAEGHVETLRSV